jgi:hypothetical protein
MESNKASDPSEIAHLSFVGVLFTVDGIANLVKEFELRGHQERYY